MNRLRYLFLLLLIVSLCCACGNGDDQQSESGDVFKDSSYRSTNDTSDESQSMSSEETTTIDEAEHKEVKQEVYELEEMQITMDLSQDTENTLFFTIGINSEVSWKLAYAFNIYSGLTDVEELNVVIMAYNEEILLSTTGLSMMRKTGKYIDAGTWCVDQLTSEAFNSDEAEALSEELQSLVLEFLELNQ